MIPHRLTLKELLRENYSFFQQILSNNFEQCIFQQFYLLSTTHLDYFQDSGTSRHSKKKAGCPFLPIT